MRVKAIIRKGLRKLPPRVQLVLETCGLLLMQRYLFELKVKLPAGEQKLPRELQQLVRQVQAHGYVVIPEFKSAQWCAEARSEIEAALGSESVVTRHREDVRVFGIERLSGRASEFATDPSLQSVARAYDRSPEVLLFCMANRVEYRPGVAHGSGGEWHRDSFKRELKAMLYLTEVVQSDGPFSIASESHRLSRIFRDVLQLAFRRGRAFFNGVSATRLKDAGEYLDERTAGRKRMFTAAPGTLILFDGSAIHTGLPPLPGGKPRLALTNYYCRDMDVETIRAYYRPLVTLN